MRGPFEVYPVRGNNFVVYTLRGSFCGVRIVSVFL